MQKVIYLVAGVVLALAASAQATLTLEIQTVTTNVTIADQSAGDQNPAVDTVEFIGTVGDWNISFATGVEGGSAEYPTLILSSSLTSTDASVITLWLSDTGFGPTPSLTTWQANYTNMPNAGVGSTFDYIKYWDTTLFGTNNVLKHFPTATESSGQNAESGSASGLWPASGTYSLTEEIVISNAMAGSDTFTANDLIVPEPSTYAMALSGLAGLGAVVRRKRH